MKTLNIKNTNNRFYIIYLFLITLTGFILRVYNLDYNSLWFDETLTMAPMDGSFWDIFKERETVQRFLILPTYNIILFPLLKIFGDSEFIIRLPSAIIGTITIPVGYCIITNIFDKRSGLIYAGLIAFSGYHIHFSREARYYPLLMLLTLLIVYSYYKYLKRPTFKHLLIYILSMLFILYTHLFSIFILSIIVIHFYTYVIYNRLKHDIPEDKLRLKKYDSGLFIIIPSFLISLTPLIIRYFSLYQGKEFGEPGKWNTSINFLLKVLFSFSSDNYIIIYTTLILLFLSILFYFKNKWFLLLLLLLVGHSFSTIFILTVKGYFLPTNYFIISFAIYFIIISISLSKILYFMSKMNFFISNILLSLFILFYLVFHIDSYKKLLFSIYRPQWKTVSEYLAPRTDPDELIISNNKNMIKCLSYYNPDLTSLINTDLAPEKLDGYLKSNKNIWAISRDYRSSNQHFEEFLKSDCVFLNRFHPLNEIMDMDVNANMGSPRIFYKIRDNEIYSSLNLRLHPENSYNSTKKPNKYNSIIIEPGQSFSRNIAPPVSEIIFVSEFLYDIILKKDMTSSPITSLKMQIDNINCPDFEYDSQLNLFKSASIIPKGSHSIDIINTGKTSEYIDYIEIRKNSDLLVENNIGAILQDNIEFTGYNGLPPMAKPGETIDLTLFWKALNKINDNYAISVHLDLLDNKSGNYRVNADHYPDKSRYHTKYWRKGEMVKDNIKIKVPLEAPLGKYSVNIGLFCPGKKNDRIKIANIDIKDKNYDLYNNNLYYDKFYKKYNFNICYDNIELCKIYISKDLYKKGILDVIFEIVEHSKPANKYKFIGRIEGIKRFHFSLRQRSDSSLWDCEKRYYLYHYSKLSQNVIKDDLKLKIWLRYPEIDTNIIGVNKNGEKVNGIRSINFKEL